MRGILVAVVFGAMTVAGCSDPDYAAPSSFTVSDSAVQQAVTAALDHTTASAKVAGQPYAECPDESTCTITYTVEEPTGIDNDMELVQPTRQIWKTLFADPQFQSGTITVKGPTTSVGGKQSTSPLFTLECDRTAADLINWDNVDGSGLKKLCTYTPKIQGM